MYFHNTYVNFSSIPRIITRKNRSSLYLWSGMHSQLFLLPLQTMLPTDMGKLSKTFSLTYMIHTVRVTNFEFLFDNWRKASYSLLHFVVHVFSQLCTESNKRLLNPRDQFYYGIMLIPSSLFFITSLVQSRTHWESWLSNWMDLRNIRQSRILVWCFICYCWSHCIFSCWNHC